MGFRADDGQSRSVDNTTMFKEQRLMYEIYLSELARRARALGYDIATGKHDNPELAHITREQIEAFSGGTIQLQMRDGVSRSLRTDRVLPVESASRRP